MKNFKIRHIQSSEVFTILVVVDKDYVVSDRFGTLSELHLNDIKTQFEFIQFVEKTEEVLLK
jgi:hypothetical protein